MDQILVTLPDGQQVVVQGSGDNARVMHRRSPGACWEPSMTLGDHPHQRDSIWRGDY